MNADLSNTKSKNYKWEVLGVVMIGTLMAALDQSIVNVSLPNIMADLGTTVTSVEWVLTGYMISFAVFIPLTTWVRERIGYKKLYITSLSVFTVGSFLCGISPNLSVLIIARIIQAIGGGALTPTGMALIAEVFEPTERGKAIGYWGVGIILGPAFGPTLGGYLTQIFGWRSIFTVNIPIGILGVIFSSKILKTDKIEVKNFKSFDFAGFIFLTIAVTFFLLALSLGEQDGWTSTFIISCYILTIIGTVGFFFVESIVQEPGIIDLQLFRSSVFSSSMLLISIRSIILFGRVFLLPLYMQNIMGYSVIDTGLLLLPSPLLMAFLMIWIGKWTDKVGPRLPTIIGLVGIFEFMYMYKNLQYSTSVMGLLWPTLIRGVGLAFLIAPIMTAALNSVPKNKAGMASSMLNLFQQLSGSIGIAFFGTFLTDRTVFQMNNLAPYLNAHNPRLIQRLTQLTLAAHHLGLNFMNAAIAAKMALANYIQILAATGAFEETFLVGAILVLISFIPVFLLPAKADYFLENKKGQEESEIMSMVE